MIISDLMVYIRACKINVIPVPGLQGLLKGGTPIKLGPLKINIIKRVFIRSSRCCTQRRYLQKGNGTEPMEAVTSKRPGII